MLKHEVTELDIRSIAQKLIAELNAGSTKLKHVAEGVKLLYDNILNEAEKLNGSEIEHTKSGPTENQDSGNNP